MSIVTKFASQSEARRAGWFSRRHEDRKAHDVESQRQRIRRDLKAEGTPQTKSTVASLDARLGVGIGASRERSRLTT